MVSIIIPTYNAIAYLPALLPQLRMQTQHHELIVIDSGSDDGTVQLLKEEGILFRSISNSDFNHGATRNFGADIAQYNTLVYLTQDALPASSTSVEFLVRALHSSTNVAMTYGRQLPYPNAGIFGRFARLTNYPPQSMVKTRENIPKMGIKSCFCSNSFAAYRKDELLSIGGFPTDTILGEDVTVAARFILQNKAVAYCAEAEVFHSHDYTILEEFRRYFDIGVFHEDQDSILKEFRKAEFEGFKYVFEEWNYLRQIDKLSLVPSQLTRTLAKYIGYRLGRAERIMPRNVKRHLSMHKSFWR